MSMALILEVRRLFGTDGVRGVTNETMTPDFVLRLSLAIATYFPKGSSILLGRDARAGSYFISKIVSGALISEGIRVYDAGLVPTPALQYYVKEKGFDGGIMVTASHNPPEYTGIKVILSDGVEAPRDVEKEIEANFWEGKSRLVSWQELGWEVKRVDDVIDFYVDSIIGKVDAELIRRRRFKVAVDPANNVGGLSTPKMLRSLGVKLVTINSEISHIPSRQPEPTPESLGTLSNVVLSEGADIGVAHDGDADRAVFVDDLGRVISGDRTALILCRHIVLNRKDKSPRRVVTAVSSSTIVEEELSRYGVETVWTKVGSVIIARKMMEIGALAGFEENGGFMYPPHQYVRDGAMSVALMLEYLAKERRKMSEVIAELPDRYLIKTKVPLRDRERLQEVYEYVAQTFSGDRIITVDGVKVIGHGYWFLIRPSGTEPVLRIFVEADFKEQAEKLLNDLKRILKSVLG